MNLKIPSENLIHVGSVELSENVLKEIKEIFEKNFSENGDKVFQFFTPEILNGENKTAIIEMIYYEIEKYVLTYLSFDNETPFLKLNEMADIKIIRQLRNKETHFNFDARNVNSLGKVLTCYINLNDIENEGEIEFFYQDLKIQPSKNEVIIFPSYFTHMHKLNASNEHKYFIKATFYFGG